MKRLFIVSKQGYNWYLINQLKRNSVSTIIDQTTLTKTINKTQLKNKQFVFCRIKFIKTVLFQVIELNAILCMLLYTTINASAINFKKHCSFNFIYLS